jgi:sorting nexin-4
MDFEELSVYLSNATTERDRLSAVISGHAGSTGLGIGSYLREKVDALRGADDDRTRVERMRKLDAKIKEVRLQCTSEKIITLTLRKQLQDAVTRAHETSDAFSEEALREQIIFQYAKEAEMKEMLGSLANAQIEFYKAVRCFLSQMWRSGLTVDIQAMDEWDRIIPVLQRIRVDV